MRDPESAALAAFHQLIPVISGARALELHPVSPEVSCELARHFALDVVQSDIARARELAAESKEAGLELRVLPSLGAGAGSERYDLIVARTTAEVSGLAGLLAPGGIVFVGGENRLGWSRRGHGSALGSSPGRTHGGYSRLFRSAGFRIRATYVSPRGHANPTELVPLQTQAIRYYTRMRLPPPGASLKRKAANFLRLTLARAWFWRAFGNDFVFILEAADA